MLLVILGDQGAGGAPVRLRRAADLHRPSLRRLGGIIYGHPVPPADDPAAAALMIVEAYCRSRVPERLRGEIVVDCSRRGRSITIVERRPPWNPEFGPEWSSQRVAQLRHDAGSDAWTLHAAERNGRWFRYDDIGPAPDVATLLVEIEQDPTGIFWG